MGSIFTNGVWTAKAGREEEFVAAWQDLADWVVATFPDAARPPSLYRDLDDRTRFVAFDEWDGAEAIVACRRHPDFRQRVDALLSGPVQSVEGAMLEPVVIPS
jgi:quinol monooxygenase YgiN